MRVGVCAEAEESKVVSQRGLSLAFFLFVVVLVCERRTKQENKKTRAQNSAEKTKTQKKIPTQQTKQNKTKQHFRAPRQFCGVGDCFSVPCFFFVHFQLSCACLAVSFLFCCIRHAPPNDWSRSFCCVDQVLFLLIGRYHCRCHHHHHPCFFHCPCCWPLALLISPTSLDSQHFCLQEHARDLKPHRDRAHGRQHTRWRLRCMGGHLVNGLAAWRALRCSWPCSHPGSSP